MSMRRRTVSSLTLVVVLAVTSAGCQSARGPANQQNDVLLLAGPRTEPAKIAPITSTPAPTTPFAAPVAAPIGPATPMYAIGPGYEHVCAVIRSTVKCLGRNQYGQLGNGTTTDSLSFVSTAISDGVQVASGSTHSCALRANGTVWCWGFGNGGLLSPDSNTDSSTPVQVPGLTGATQISAGANGSCARRSNGTLSCWGLPFIRGDGGTGPSPLFAPTITDVVKVAVAGEHVCALKADGTIWCWGANTQGQLGNGTVSAEEVSPVQVTGITTAVDVAAGGFDGLACAALATGAPRCWGDDGYGQLGDGDASTADRTTPNPVATLTGATQVSIGFAQTCTLSGAGVASCWGRGSYLGTAVPSDSTSPVAVSEITDAVAVRSQSLTTCVLNAAGAAKCWGINDIGQLGNGATTGGNSVPVTVVGIP